MTYFGIYRWMRLSEKPLFDKEILDLQPTEDEIDSNGKDMGEMNPDLKVRRGTIGYAFSQEDNPSIKGSLIYE